MSYKVRTGFAAPYTGRPEDDTYEFFTTIEAAIARATEVGERSLAYLRFTIINEPLVIWSAAVGADFVGREGFTGDTHAAPASERHHLQAAYDKARADIRAVETAWWPIAKANWIATKGPDHGSLKPGGGTFAYQTVEEYLTVSGY